MSGIAPRFERTEEGEFVLRPPDCPSREQLERGLSEPVVLAADPPPPRGLQYSVGDVMIVMVGVAAGLAGGSWMPTDLFAAIMGLATLVGLLIVSCHPPETRLGKVVWASFVIAYFMAVLAAVLRPPVGPG